jgi:hypothetical protein
VGGKFWLRAVQKKLRPGGSGDDYKGYGFCWIRFLIDEGIIDYAKNEVKLSNYHASKRGGVLNQELPIDLATLGGCDDGITPDQYPKDLPEKGSASVFTPEGRIEFARVYASRDGLLNITSEVDLEKVEIIDLAGKVAMASFNLSAGKERIPVSSLAAGVYVVKLTSAEKYVQLVKFIR